MKSKLLYLFVTMTMVFSLFGVTSPAVAEDGDIRPPPPLQRIPFVSDRDANLEIYVMDANGANQTRLTNVPAYDNMPVPSPDGTRIAFMSTRHGNREIYTMNADNGSGLIRLTTNNATDMWPAWSPDGSKIVFSSNRDGNQEIYSMNATDGSGLTRLTSHNASDSMPAWSSTGKIVFVSLRDGDYAEIYVMDANGNNQTRLTTNPARDILPAWSPDGTKIAFTSARDGNAEVYVMEANGDNQTNLTNNPADDGQPFWLPDGTKIAFTTNREGNPEVYVMDANGANHVNLSQNSAGEWLRGKWVWPTVTTDNATAITASSATLNGTLDSIGTAGNVTIAFDWGLSTGNYSAATPLVSMNTTGAFSANLTGLSANTTYYFRAKAMGDGPAFGAESSFTTGLSIGVQAVTLVSDNTGLISLNGITTDGAYLYISGNAPGSVPAVARVPITGGNGTILYTYGNSPLSLAVIGNNIFWIDPNSGPYTDTQILKAPKDGSGPITAILTSSQAGNHLEDGSGLATDGVKLYGADEIQGRVYSLNQDGSGLTQLDGNRYGGWFDTEHFNTITESGGILYIADSGRESVIQPQVVTIPATGAASFTPLWVGTPFVQPVGVTVGAGKIFVSDQGAGNTIWMLPTTGGTPTALISGAPFVSLWGGLTFFNDALYVVDNGQRAIYRVELATSPPAENWTFMVYMGADNDLDLAGIDDLNEMEVVGSTDNVNILALFDRYGNGNTNLYRVVKDFNTSVISSTPITGVSPSEVNMGDPITLINFVEWAVANYPATNYALVLWDHGSGWKVDRVLQPPIKGIVIDDTSGGDRITTAELGTALSQIKTDTGVTIDIVGFDACLMQMLEIAYQIGNTASIIVGSEETEPADGWPYDTILADLVNNSTLSSEALATTIVNKYGEDYSIRGTGVETMSAMWIAADLGDATSYLADSLVASGEWGKIVAARTLTEYFYYPDYVDLYHFAQNIKAISSNTTVQSYAQAVMDDITSYLIANWHGPLHPNARGISIYFPISGSVDPNYANLLLSQHQTWDEFLSWYLTAQAPTWTQIISDPTGDNISGGPDITGVFTSLSANVSRAFQVRLANTIDWNNFWGVTLLDTNQDGATTEYVIYAGPLELLGGGSVLSLPRLDINEAGRSAGQPVAALFEYGEPTSQFITLLPLYTDSNSYWTTVPLSLLGPDDGNMDTMQSVGMGVPGPETSTDFAPNPTPPPPPVWWRLIDDPVGDGSPDIISVDSFRWPDRVGFRINGTFDFSDLYTQTYLDTDQNPATGKAVNDIGADYMIKVYIHTGASPAGELMSWNGTDFEEVYRPVVNTDNSSFWFEVLLSQLSNDQGNMDVVQIAGVYPGTTVDTAPDTGHRTIGEPRWTTLFTDPIGDQFEGTGPDITRLDINRRTDRIHFRVVGDNFSFDNLKGVTYIDIDQNPTTGNLTNDIGVDYIAVVTTRTDNVTFPPLTGKLWRWTGTAWEEIVGLGVFANSNYYWFGIGFDRMGNDEGDMDVVQGIGTPDAATDKAPDTGHGTIATRESIEASINDGIAWLASQQKPDGSWGTMWPVAKTGLAVLKLETHATSANISPFDPAYPYHTQVEAGLNYLFRNAYIANVTVQPAGNPDTNGNGKGVYFYTSNFSLVRNHYVPVYETSIAMMALAASNNSTRVVSIPGSPIDGWTYAQVLQDAVDYIAWAQTDAGSWGRGGWNYEPMNNNGSRSDQSNTGWATLALAYAESPPPTGFNLVIPGFVRSELNVWIDYIQDDVNGNPDDGGAWYTGIVDPSPGKIVGANMLRTGNLLQQMAFVGDTLTTPRVRAALDYLVRHWSDNNSDPGWRGNPSNYHATYTVMKGLEAFRADNLSGINWFQEFVDNLLYEQNPDGSWLPCNYDDGEQILSTEWALLTLQKTTAPTREGPDLVVYEKHEQWVNEPARTYNVYATVKNRGNTPVPAGFWVELAVDGMSTENVSIGSDILPDGVFDISFSNTLTLTGEADEITVRADALSQVAELNEDNNSLTNTWQPSVQVRIDAPDLVPSGGKFVATVNISQVYNFDAANYDVSFNATVLSLGNVTAGNIGGTTIPVDIFNQTQPGRFTIVQNVPGIVGANGTGYLAVLHFQVVGSLGQNSNISLSNGVLSNNQALEIPAEWFGDVVHVSGLQGDANGDGAVDALDITKVERIIAGWDDPTPGADANLDGHINALDITKVERYIGGLDAPPY